MPPLLLFVPYALALLGFVDTFVPRRATVHVAVGEPGPADLARSGRVSGRDPRPLRIVQITDPHLGPFMSVDRLQRICERAVETRPDLVLLTGDFLTMESQADMTVLGRALALLKALEGRCFACLGNHDHEAPAHVRGGLASAGVVLLVDEMSRVETAAGPVEILGFDFRYRDRKAHLEEVSSRHARSPGVIRLGLLHDPGAFRHLPRGTADLVLSGHTHGGQLGLLWMGLPQTVVSALSRIPDHGLWARGKDRLYVHRGTGHYGFPLRIGVPPEESVLELHRAAVVVPARARRGEHESSTPLDAGLTQLERSRVEARVPGTQNDKSTLSKKDRRFALLLGAPSFALALCLAVLSTYLPLLARRFTESTAIIGLLVGAEGLIAVLLPVLVGRLSDRTETRLGPRLPFLIATAPVAALALVLLPFAPSLPVMAAEVFVFYLAYFAYFSPYRALYPDLVSESASARAQGIQGVFNAAGLGCALVGGGVLLDLWRPLPYLLAAMVLLLATGLRSSVRLGRTKPQRSSARRDERSPFAELWELLHGDPELARFVIGNALLTLGLAGLKSFVVLWLTEGLGKSMTFTAGAMTVVAVGTVVGALVSGKLGDRYGPGRVLPVALCVFGTGLAVGTFSTSVAVLGVAFPFIALAGGAAGGPPVCIAVVATCPSQRSHGIVAGLFLDARAAVSVRSSGRRSRVSRSICSGRTSLRATVMRRCGRCSACQCSQAP